MKNPFRQIILASLSLSFLASVSPTEADITDVVEQKINQTVRSPFQRFKSKASTRFHSLVGKMNGRTYTSQTEEEPAPAPKYYTKKTISKPTKTISFEPEMSSLRSPQQVEAQVDQMILAQWSKPEVIDQAEWKKILSAVKTASRETGIPQQLLMSLIKKESGFNPYNVSRSGAIGLTQLMPSTALTECNITRSELFEIDSNVMCGAKYLEQQITRFKKLDLALAAYNAGPGAVRRAIEETGSENIHVVTAKLKPETAPYVRKILATINYGSDFI
jgi:hypothetical protein